MAGNSRPPSSQLINDTEVGYKIHGYVLYDPAENLFNGGLNNIAVAPFAGTVSRTGMAFAYWYNATDYLDIEFFDDVRIWDCGYSSSSHWGALNVFDNTNGIQGSQVGILSAYSGTFNATTPNWVMIGTLKKGRYKVVKGTSLRVSHEWFLELNSQKRTTLKSNNKFYSLLPTDVWYDTKMTSNTSPSPLIASASTSYNANYYPYRAFNGTNTTGNYDQWLTQSSILEGWIQLDFGSSKRINRLKLGASSDYLNANPKDFDILYSNDGVNFNIAKSIKNETSWINGEYREYGFKVVNARYMRIKVLTINGGINYVAIGEILYGLKTLEMTEFTEISSDSFIKYGVHKLEKLEQQIYIKNYVSQKNSPKNEDGLLVRKVNKKPLSIALKNT